MREGSTLKNPINGYLYKSMYPKVKLPNNTYIRYQNKLYLKKNDNLNFIKAFFNTRRPESEKSRSSSDNRQSLKKKWVKKWKLEIEAQKYAQ